MKTLMVVALLLGLTAALGMVFSGFLPAKDLRAHTVAVDFGQYRRAAWLYAHEHPDHEGVIALAQLDMPEGWQASRWEAHLIGGVCYVWGHATEAEIGAVFQQYENSQAIGQARGGSLRPWGYDLPEFIPAGALVSLMEVR